MTEEIFKDLCLCGETTKVQFKQAFTSQREIAKEMIAFANSKGGVIMFGVEDKTGKLVGLSYEQIQQTSRELGNAANEQVRPTIYIETEVVRVENKHFLVCSVEQGKNKPYKNLNGEIWVKQGADKRRVTENTEILAECPNMVFQNDSVGNEFKVTLYRGVLDTTQKDEITTQKRVLVYLHENPKATRVEVADALGNITADGVKFIIAKLQQKGLLKRVGGRKHGEWVVCYDENNTK